MPARSIANATISFGLVSVPINIFSSAESKASVSFNMLHKKCKGRLKQQYICPRDDNEVVTRDETVKGYEFAKDQYVVPLEEKATSSITFSSYGSARHQARPDSVSGCRRISRRTFLGFRSCARRRGDICVFTSSTTMREKDQARPQWKLSSRRELGRERRTNNSPRRFGCTEEC